MMQKKGMTVTGCCTAGATGNTVPPVMKVHFEQPMVEDAPSGTLGPAPSSGCITLELFIQITKRLIFQMTKVTTFRQPGQSVGYSNSSRKVECSNISSRQLTQISATLMLRYMKF